MGGRGQHLPVLHAANRITRAAQSNRSMAESHSIWMFGKLIGLILH